MLSPENLPLDTRVSISRISLNSKKELKLSKKLDVLVDSEPLEVAFDVSSSKDNRRWNVDPSIDIWPNSVLLIQPYQHHALRRFLSPTSIQAIEIEAEDLLQRCSVAVPGEKLEYTHDIEDFVATLTISPASFSTAVELEKATIRQQAVAQAANFTKSSLADVFGESLGILGQIMGIVRGIATIHPAAESAVKAITLIYTLFKNVQTFHEGLLDLGYEINQLLSLLAAIKDPAKIEYLQYTIVAIMKLICKATSFTQDYLDKKTLGKAWEAQFLQPLDGYKKQFAFFGSVVDRAMLAQILTDVASAEDNEVLKDLRPVQDQGKSPSFLEGTRKDILGAIFDWIDNGRDHNILWLSGSPGAGKSAIASRVVSDLCERRLLGSSFFFRSGDAYRGNPASFWRTVGFDLAKFDNAFRKSIVPILKEGKAGATRDDVELHFKYLIESPLLKDPKSSPIKSFVVVLDALDEAGTPPDRKILLSTLSKWSRLSPTFKLLITSRVEYDIVNSLQMISHRIVLPTGTDVDEKASSDIRLFFNSAFSELTGRYTSLGKNWPGEPTLKLLTTRAAGLFIWAETVIKLMSMGDPKRQLRFVLSGGDKGADIGDLYQNILNHRFPNPHTETLQSFRNVVGFIILSKIPPTRDLLIHLLRLEGEETSVEFILTNLYSVISTAESDPFLRSRHQSFVDFLTNPKRRSEPFFIDRDKQSLHLLQCCFRTMNGGKGLKFNVCNLTTSYHFNDDVPNIAELIATNISVELDYSCRFWAHHLWEINGDLSSLVEDMRKFVYEHLLAWLEVLSFKKEVPSAPGALNSLARRISSLDERLSNFASDGSRFSVTFRQPISESAPHIYLSALPFCPENSELGKRYTSEYPNSMSVVCGREKDWPALSAVLESHESSVVSVAFSLDGKYIVSGSDDQTIRVWDVEKGTTAFGPFEGHTDSVTSVAFSPDGKYVVSGSDDKAIRVWDVEKGTTAFGPFEGHTDWVRSVAFSPDGQYVVSGSGDNSIRVWDVEKGTTAFGPFEGHTDRVRSVAFSPDGKYVVSGSGKTRIQLISEEGTASETIEEMSSPITPPFLVGVLTWGFRDNTLLGSNGWMYNPDTGDLLFWVPPQARAGLWRPRTAAVLGVPSTQLDFTAFAPLESVAQ